MGSFLISGVFHIGHGAEARIRHVGGYVSYFGGIPGPNATHGAEARMFLISGGSIGGLHCLLWVVSILGHAAEAQMRNV